MGLFGLGKGITKTIVGIVTGDTEEIVKGIKKIAVNTITIISGDLDEAISSDDDDE